MEQIERILKMMQEFEDNLKKEFGKYNFGVEVIDGRKKVILVGESGERHVMGFMVNSKGLNLIAFPEGEEDNISLTELERQYLETAGHRAVHVFTSKFYERTGWQLTALSAVFGKGSGAVFLTWEEGELSITEGSVEFEEDDE